jgi:hypothetical protein
MPTESPDPNDFLRAHDDESSYSSVDMCLSIVLQESYKHNRCSMKLLKSHNSPYFHSPQGKSFRMFCRRVP